MDIKQGLTFVFELLYTVAFLLVISIPIFLMWLVNGEERDDCED